uniref:Secreted protein n=1 Tax=Anguilla anguilla TaxID=7936 RepID=A0A0E9X1I1_ANGAN
MGSGTSTCMLEMRVFISLFLTMPFPHWGNPFKSVRSLVLPRAKIILSRIVLQCQNVTGSVVCGITLTRTPQSTQTLLAAMQPCCTICPYPHVPLDGRVVVVTGS